MVPTNLYVQLPKTWIEPDLANILNGIVSAPSGQVPFKKENGSWMLDTGNNWFLVPRFEFGEGIYEVSHRYHVLHQLWAVSHMLQAFYDLKTMGLTVEAQGATPAARFVYVNHRGETAERHVTPMGVRFGTGVNRTTPQWLLMAWDRDRNALRDFTLEGINKPRVVALRDLLRAGVQKGLSFATGDMVSSETLEKLVDQAYESLGPLPVKTST